MFARALTKMVKLPLFWILVAQSSIAIVASIVCLLISKVAAISALLAGMSGVLPSLYLVLVSLKPVLPGETGLMHVLRGEVGKIILTIALLSGIFGLVKSIDVIVFFSTFILMQVCQLAAFRASTGQFMERSSY